MKKKNLNFLLALIAALALVFAAGCDTSGDSASGGGSSYTSLVSGATYTYAGDDTTTHSTASTTYLEPVTFAFDSTGTGVTMSVQYVACGTAATGNDAGSGGQSACTFSENPTCTLYTWSGSATYTYMENPYGANTVTVALPASDDETAVTGATLTFELADGALTLAAAKTSTDTDLTGYTVVADDDEAEENAGVDIFSGDYGLSTSDDGTEFPLVEDNEG